MNEGKKAQGISLLNLVFIFLLFLPEIFFLLRISPHAVRALGNALQIFVIFGLPILGYAGLMYGLLKEPTKSIRNTGIILLLLLLLYLVPRSLILLMGL